MLFFFFLQLILIDDDNFNVKVKLSVNVAGTIRSFNPDDRTFTMAPSLYAGLTRKSPTISIQAHFVDSEKRWGTHGPKVTAGSIVAFGGRLERIVRECDVDRSLSFVKIEVLNIAYLSTRGEAFTSPSRMIFFHFFPHERQNLLAE